MSTPRDSDGPGSRDESLVRSVVSGDPLAADELIDRFRGLVVGLARSRYGYTPSEADELLQSVIALLWRDDYRALRAWRGQSKLSTYLSVIVCRECRRQKGLAQRRQAVETSTDYGEPVAASAAPDQQTLDREQSRALQSAMSELNARDRLVLAYRYFDEREPSEFASALGLTPGAARKAVHDALGRLRRKMVPRRTEP